MRLKYKILLIMKNIVQDFKAMLSSKNDEEIKLRKNFFLTLFTWTLLVIVSLTWNIWNSFEDTKNTAENIARSNFHKDQAIRFWAASHGGVYVPATKRTPPNPNLSHIPQRDIVKLDGTKLTLMNPAYMIRQLMDDYEGLYGVKGRITSLKYFHEGNKPDEWETKALKLFQKGVKEVYEYIEKGNEPYLRFMRPMYTKKMCLKCHAKQGYKEGDVRGGVGVLLPMKTLNVKRYKQIYTSIFVHFVLWISVLIGILSVTMKSLRNISNQRGIEEELRINQHYLQNLFESTPNIMITTNGQEIERANRAMLEFTGYNSIEEFKKEHDCICDLFMDGKELLSSSMGDMTWLDYALEHQKMLHKVKMMRDDKVYSFLVWAKLLHINTTKRSVVTFTDVTELEEAYNALNEKDEIMLAQSRHAAMGEMISMIAHQWRQPISAIAMGANNILADIELEDVDETRLKDGANNIVLQTQELSKTIDDFRGFFRPNKHVESVFIEDIFKDVYSVIGKSLENNSIETSWHNNSNKIIQTYSRELMQVFINIIKNAKEAMVEHDIRDGKINIYVDEVDDKMLVKICDNGGGISDDIIEHIFDPYFTTKSEKNGTGLGLYMSKTIIEKHLNGILNVKNIDNGVCFIVELPCSIENIGKKDG